MKKFSLFSLLLLVLYLLPSSNGCKDNSVESLSKSDTTGYVDHRKPNIYLYPVKACSLSVRLEFPSGGKVTESIPAYSAGWNVYVEPSGKINGSYDYLFYEADAPNLYQYESGWIVKKELLRDFFEKNMSETGFNDKEIKDFTEYWIPRLNESPYYTIYPQYSGEIMKTVKLNISVSPDNILRLFYVIKGTGNPAKEIKTPVIPKFQRSGFVVAEWGVII